MIAVSSTRWSPALATLLLLMSTTLQPFLLPTVQASVVSGIVRQMWRPSVDSNSGLTKDGSMLAAGRLGAHGWSPDALLCINSLKEQGSVANATLVACVTYQEFWLQLIELFHNGTTEQQCKELYCQEYCLNLVGHSFCTANQSAALLKDLRDEIDGNAKACKQSASWIPPMDSLPQITSESLKCTQTLGNEGDVVKCVEDVVEKVKEGNATTEDLATELWCKTFFAEEKCNIDGVCKYCPSANELLSLKAQFWTPAKVECTKWSNDKPKYECPVTSSSPASVSVTTSSSNTLMIVGIIIGVLVLLVAIGVAVYCLCFSTDKSAGPSSNAGSGGGSGASSKLNSGKAGSTMDSKQQSRIEAKQSSRA